MDFYLKIDKNEIIKIYNETYTVQNGKIGHVMKDNQFREYDEVDNLQKFTLPKDKESLARSKDNFIIENGIARLKTESELAEEKKPHEKAAAFEIHRRIVGNMRVEANGEVYAFDHFSMIFFLAEFSLNSQNGFEWKPKGKAERMHTAAEVIAIFTAARKTIRDSFTAYNLDRLDILDNADFSMTRLNSELDKQKALKE